MSKSRNMIPKKHKKSDKSKKTYFNTLHSETSVEDTKVADCPGDCSLSHDKVNESPLLTTSGLQVIRQNTCRRIV